MSPRPSLKNPSMSFGPASARRPKRSRGSGSLLIRRFLESCSFAVIAVVFACSAVDWSLSLRALRALRSIVFIFASFARFAVDRRCLRVLGALCGRSSPDRDREHVVREGRRELREGTRGRPAQDGPGRAVLRSVTGTLVHLILKRTDRALLVRADCGDGDERILARVRDEKRTA